MVALLALFVAGPTFAQGNKYTFGTRNQKKVSKAFDLINEGNVEGGLEILNNINLKRAKPYGRARILCTLGGI